MTRAVTGLLLAAGAGRRMGRPKALVYDPHTGESWLHRSVSALADGGCTDVTVVLGAESAAAIRLLGAAEADARVVVADDWASGMGDSLAAGLRSLEATRTEAVLVMLVDLPDVGAQVIRRVLDCAQPGPDALARASYQGTPGHPVLLGRQHWRQVVNLAVGDQGARRYLEQSTPRLVECGDLGTGADIDTAAC